MLLRFPVLNPQRRPQMATTTESILSQALLDKCRDRAPVYARENRFFQEDFDALKAAGYLQMAVPKEFGGLGMNLVEVGRVTRRLAQYAPATPLGPNLHNYMGGDARVPPRTRSRGEHAQLLGWRRRGRVARRG